jgi:FkbM family methyltransferase
MNLAFFVLYLLTNPRYFRHLVAGVYLPVYIQFEWLQSYNVATFIDVGAHKGVVSKVFSYLFPEVTLYCFEPIESLAEQITQSLPTAHVFVGAVGNKVGEANLHITDYSPASSLRAFTTHYKSSFGKEKKVGIKTTTLDHYFENTKIERPAVLKIDTQGFEREVLLGAKKTLRSIDIVHIESTLVEIYEGQALFNEVHTILVDAGFQYVGTSADSEFIPKFSPQEVQNSIYKRIS